MIGAAPRILLLDDEPDKAHALMRWLEPSNIDVVYRSSPSEVIETLKNPVERFDVLVLDMMMPGSHGEEEGYDDPDLVESGLRLHRIIRGELKLQGIPIIFLSVVRDANIRNAVRAEEAKYQNKVSFMSKPVLAADLVERIRKVSRA